MTADPSRRRWTLVALMAAGIAVSVVAGAVALGNGLTVQRAVALLSDPKSSPLVTSPTWIAISVLASEAVLATLIWRFLRRHRVFLHEVCPLGVPSLRDLAGALLCVFGLAYYAKHLRRLGKELAWATR